MNTILFDLDGTLLPMDDKLFGDLYLQELGKVFQDTISLKQLIPIIFSSIGEMILNTELRTNEEVFMEHLGKKVNGSLDLYKQGYKPCFS